MLPVRFRPIAADELLDAWRWYEDQRVGLGAEFRACIDESIGAIDRSPLSSPRVRGEARRRLDS